MEAINSRSWVLSLAFSIPVCTLSAVTPVELVWTSVSFVFQSPTVCNFPEPRVHLSEVGMGCRDKVWGIPGHSLWDLLPGNAVIPPQWDKNVSELHRSVQTPAGSIYNTVRKKRTGVDLGVKMLSLQLCGRFTLIPNIQNPNLLCQYGLLTMM